MKSLRCGKIPRRIPVLQPQFYKVASSNIKALIK